MYLPLMEFPFSLSSWMEDSVGAGGVSFSPFFVIFVIFLTFLTPAIVAVDIFVSPLLSKCFNRNCWALLHLEARLRSVRVPFCTRRSQAASPESQPFLPQISDLRTLFGSRTTMLIFQSRDMYHCTIFYILYLNMLQVDSNTTDLL